MNKKNGIVETVLIGRVIIFSMTLGSALTITADKVNEDKTPIKNIELKNYKK